MTSVSNQVESVSNTDDGIISALTMLGERGKSLEADLMSAQSQLDSITAALEGVVTSEELGLISNTSADIQADVRDILEKNAIVNQNITINSITYLERLLFYSISVLKKIVTAMPMILCAGYQK